MKTEFQGFVKSNNCSYINNAIDYYMQARDHLNRAYMDYRDNKLADMKNRDKESLNSFERVRKYLLASGSKHRSDLKIKAQLEYLIQLKTNPLVIICKNSHANTIPRHVLYPEMPFYYAKCTTKDCNETIKFELDIQSIEPKELIQETTKQEAQTTKTEIPF